MKLYTVGVLGATGAVGQEMMNLLEERNFPVGKLVPLASARSAGKTLKFRGEDVVIQESFEEGHEPDRFITGITGKKDFTIISLSKKGMSNQVGVLHKVLTVLVRHNISVDYVPNGIDNVSVVFPSESAGAKLYAILSDIQNEVQPDTLQIHDHIAVVAAVGRKMAYRPGISGKLFAALGESGINIRMINQGPDELNIIFGVDNKDFEEAIKVLYNSFVTK